MIRPIAAVALCLLLLVGSAAFGDDWMLYRGSTARLGRSTEVLSPPLAPAWSFETGGRIISSPAVYGNTVYFGSMDGLLYAVDASTGALRWSYDGGGEDSSNRGIVSSPCVSNGVVYVSTRSGRLLAVDATSGSLVWEYRYGGQNQSSPIVSNGVVYCGSGYPTKSLVAVRASDGQKVWEMQAGQYVYSSPAVSGNIVYVGGNDGYFRAYDAATGAPAWSAPFYTKGGIYLSTPAIENGKLFCAPGDYDRRIYCINATTGAKIWEFTVPQQGWQTWSYVSSPTLSGSTVYTVGGYPNEVLYALDSTNGAKRWQFTVGSATSDLFAASPTVSGNIVYVGSWSGDLYALDAATGQQKWSYKLPGGIGASAAVANGKLYVGSTDGALYAFTPTKIFTSPTGYVKPGWNLVSVPAKPANPDPLVVFAGLDIADASLQYWRNDLNGGGYQNYGDLFGWIGPVETGIPYWFLHDGADQTVSYEGVPTTTDQTITIPAHMGVPCWVMLAHPMDHRTSTADIRFSTPTNPTPVDWPTAVSNKWVDSSMQGYEKSSSAYVTIGYPGNLVERSVLEPWYGYWLMVTTSEELRIHIPVSPVAP